MKLIYHPVFLEHDTGMHPENVKRLTCLGYIPITDVPSGEEFLPLIHSAEYIEHVRRACELRQPLDGDTVVSNRSFEAAIRAVGATLQAAETGDFAVVRPPGHHAYPDRASGFCLFNNVAIAAQKLVNEGKRVLIFDFDGHLGDGTSAIFYNTDQVMYWSIHQYPAFPGHGYSDEIGEGPGIGYTLNVPLPSGSGDDIFMDAVRCVLPYAKKFNPDVVAVSAGFDAHQYDLLLDLRLTAGTYYRIGQMLSGEFKHVFATLEGGYNVEELPLCIDNFLDGINGAPMRHKQVETESDIRIWTEYEAHLNTMFNSINPYWK